MKPNSTAAAVDEWKKRKKKRKQDGFIKSVGQIGLAREMKKFPSRDQSNMLHMEAA
jgi:hypothetical protein